jgi:glycosyltransferase involved in cell wall biosynthesis
MEGSILPEKLYDLCFEGFLNFERGLKQLFQLIVHLKTLKQDVKLLILGAISDEESKKWADRFIKDNNLYDNIVFSGWQPYEVLYEYHIKCRIGIYLFQYNHNTLLSDPPNKLFNFMKAGLPIVASDLPETMNILEGVGCGIAVKPDDLVAIKNAVVKLLENETLRNEMGARGLKAFNSKYNWNFEEQKLKKVYGELFSEQGS